MKKLSKLLIQALIDENEEYADSILEELLEENKDNLSEDEKNLIKEHLINKE